MPVWHSSIADVTATILSHLMSQSGIMLIFGCECYLDCTVDLFDCICLCADDIWGILVGLSDGVCTVYWETAECGMSFPGICLLVNLYSRVCETKDLGFFCFFLYSFGSYQRKF